MAQKTKHYEERLKPHEVGFWQSFWHDVDSWAVKHHFWKRLYIGVVAILILSISGMYGIAKWYIHKHQNEPLQIGATFIPDYARYLNLDPKQTFYAIIDDLGVKRVRLVSYWDNIENTQGLYNFDELDWQFQKAEQAKVKVSLSLGLRQPRWPECHMPSWAEKETAGEWQPQLNNFLSAVVNRYKNSPALDSYQLENEYFLKVFGICTNFDRNRLVSEYNLVKSLDPLHTLVVSMSNNAIGTPIFAPTPDEWSISVYKRVWDKTLTRRYFEYPIPAWYYAFRAGFTELTRGRNVFIHELQAEPWIPDSIGSLVNSTIAEQDKSLNASRLNDRIEYGKATGIRTIDLWGAEWWYWRKVSNDPSLWNTAKVKIEQANNQNQNLRDNGKIKIDLDVIKN